MAPSSYPASQRLRRRFFARPTLEVARDLVGRHLVLQEDDARLALRLVEVEAYLGQGRDAASHAHRGRTERNAEMFETPGLLYVYFTYGMHHCMNVVCERRGVAGAVLLRAAEPLEGIDRMLRRRGKGGRELTNGPAKLCQALGVDLRWRGLDLVDGPLGLWPGEPVASPAVSGRVGIREARDRPYRFFDPESPWSSRARPT